MLSGKHPEDTWLISAKRFLMNVLPAAGEEQLRMRKRTKPARLFVGSKRLAASGSMRKANQSVTAESDMPKGPKGQKRPADVIGNAVLVAKIATGEVEETNPPDDGKDKAAQEMGRKGGKARAQAMTPERRAEVARKAAAKRWSKSG